jgi:DNA (cytosine-5)-methyltransferase 1
MANKTSKKKIEVVELFAGVGGFRIGLEGYKGKSASSGYKDDFDSPFKVVWSNQFEPSTKVQHASDVYVHRFGAEGHVNEDIFPYPTKKIPHHDMLVGGFPCQDYSVARTLNQAEGLVGKKGVLWWAIHRILEEKKEKRASIVFLENVDRLLKSPAQQRGRDFAIMLTSLANLGYIVEWRVINAADYGMPQRRRRVFIVAYRLESPIGKEFLKHDKPVDWILTHGIFARAFPVTPVATPSFFPFEIPDDLEKISRDFPACLLGRNLDSAPNLGRRSPFENGGVMINRLVYTFRTHPIIEPPVVLDDVVFKNGKVEIPASYYLSPESRESWIYLKGAKKDNWRISKSGHRYNYNEGPLPFPDPLDRPARPIITAYGGPTPSIFKLVVEINTGHPRRLIPEELERLNMFPTGHTRLNGISDVKRAFFMGNALVIGVVERIGREIARRYKG